ncbi:hypothetical protein D3C79_373860 [compost metagenome]
MQHGVKHRVAVQLTWCAHFGKLTQLQPQALDDFISLLRRQHATGDVLLIEAVQQFVEAAWVNRVAAVFQVQCQLEEVERLASLFKAAGPVSRDFLQHGGCFL